MTDKKPKLTQKRAKFVKGIAEGKTQRQSYLDAYNCSSMSSSVDEQASRLAAEWGIRYVINEIEKIGRDKADEVLAEYSKYSQDSKAISIASMRSIYVMKCHEYHKIGIAANPRRRLNAIKTSNPYEVELIRAVKVPDAIGLERQLHRQFAECRVRGEWFELTDTQITEVIERISEVADGN